LVAPVHHIEVLCFGHHHQQSTEVVCILTCPVPYVQLALLLCLFVSLLSILLVVLPLKPDLGLQDLGQNEPLMVIAPDFGDQELVVELFVLEQSQKIVMVVLCLTMVNLGL